MQPSNIQLTDLVFYHVNISARVLDTAERESLPFDFDGVQVAEKVDLRPIDESKDAPKQYALRMRIQITNEAGKLAPYKVDVEAAGLFSVNPNMPPEGLEDFVVINGSGVIYGAIREQVVTVTSRGLNGPLMLPTVTFLDYKGKLKAASTQPSSGA